MVIVLSKGMIDIMAENRMGIMDVNLKEMLAILKDNAKSIDNSTHLCI